MVPLVGQEFPLRLPEGARLRDTALQLREKAPHELGRRRVGLGQWAFDRDRLSEEDTTMAWFKKQKTTGSEVPPRSKVAEGMWLANTVLLFIGFLFLKQARADARLFDSDFYNVVWDKLKRRFAKTKTTNFEI